MWEIWQNFSGGMWNYAIEAYAQLEPWTYPLFFLGIIGYVYTCTHSVTAMVIAIIGTFGLWATSTAIFADVQPMVLLFNIITVIGISALLFTLIIKKVAR